MKKYVVRLGEDERRRLTKLATTGKGPARVFTRARILLEADESDAGPAWP